MLRLTNKRNPLGLELGERIITERTTEVDYNEKGERCLFHSHGKRTGVVIGIVKKALGTSLRE